jgi:hypothetical protein
METIDDQEPVISELEKFTYIDGHGSLRAVSLAVLLFLGDHLDGSFTRTAAHYMLGSKDDNPIAKFRKIVYGTRVDFENGLIRTVIRPPSVEERDFELENDYLNKTKKRTVKNGEEICGEIVLGNKDVLSVFSKPASNNEKTETDEECESYWEAFRGVCYNVYENMFCLKLILGRLSEMGMALNGWFLDCDDMLYSCAGQLTGNAGQEEENKTGGYSPEMISRKNENLRITLKNELEPNLDIDYVFDVLHAMYSYGGGTFGAEKQEYDVIINGMHVTRQELPKVKTAVKRISNVFKKCRIKNGKFLVHCSDTHWWIESNFSTYPVFEDKEKDEITKNWGSDGMNRWVYKNLRFEELENELNKWLKAYKAESVNEKGGKNV